MAAAFADDPAWTFMLGPGQTGQPGQPGSADAFARALLLPRIRTGTAWVTDDCSAVAMWDRRPEPDRDDDARDAHDAKAPPDPTVAPDPWPAFRGQVGEDVCARIEAYEAAVAAVQPARPFWYLGVLATHPDVQGRGLATAVMRPGLDRAAADGWDCWLETSTERNRRFYAGRGFTQSRAVDIPGGPPTWWLRRPHGGTDAPS